MYTIGDISRIVNISANTLRYYDEIGLLKPHFVENTNQYRYYSDPQIKDITFILELKQYGFSLEEIKILVKDENGKRLKPMLEKKLIELQENMDKLKERYVILEKRISKINREEFKMREDKVLIVDDFVLARKMIRNIIEDYGYTVVGEASNGEEAVSAYNVLRPEIVIMDVTMPKMDGICAASKIMDEHKNAKIIMCSAMSKVSIVLESIKLGARDFVSKPISSMRLIEAMEGEQTINIERINNIANMLQKESNEKVHIRALKQEEIDLIIFKDERQEEEAINNIFYDSVSENKDYINGPEAVDLEDITYIKDKFSESLQEFSRGLYSRLNITCKLGFVTIQNVTISEFKTLMSEDSDIGVIKYNVSSLPINIYVSGSFNDKRKLLTEIISLTEKLLERIIHGFDNVNKFISLGEDKLLSENYSTIAISFSIEFSNKDNGFINISLPHDFLQYLDK
ncbi:response regulator [Clostridium hydrogenum]|uniref:response regulator n=1 Tax=Clostridium hydrogenum TaxID=2855764 RepID=UPI001F45B1BC|nr:response regulator [Clostridium hydrogenum]